MYEKKEAKLAKGSLTYYVSGKGRPILYIHSGTGVRMTEPLETLAKTFTVHMPILPGFEGTAEVDGVSDTRSLAELLIEFADKMSSEKWDVMGHSIGGAVAAWIAILAPDRVDQLILTAPGGFQPKDAPPMPSDPKKMLAAAYAHPEKIKPDNRAPEVAAKNREMAMKYSGGKTRDETLLGKVGEIKALTLILQGEQDGIIADGAVQNLRASIPRSHLIYLYDAAHVPEVDQPERFSRVVGDFLTRGEAFIVNWGNQPVPVGA
jgi:pimeloyl-ACP methyl ester carboxylesterase